MSRLVSVFVFFLLAPLLAVAQSTDSSAVIGEACNDSAYRAFDFWLGHWSVHDSTGARVGMSRITRQARGCGVLEEWSGTSGSWGTSLNYYDSDAETWHQNWVGSSGLLLHLTGGREEHTMVLEGTRRGKDGSVRDRIRWRPLDDGRVRQEWVVSSDGGKTWKRVFLGFYQSVQP